MNLIFSCCRKANAIRVVFSKEKWNMLFGYVINMLIPLILPWSFVLMEIGVKNYRTKLNTACYLVLYFVGLFFPIYYFFDLLQEREQILINERKEKEKEE